MWRSVSIGSIELVPINTTPEVIPEQESPIDEVRPGARRM